MSVYLGTTLLAGTPDITGKANTSLNNLTSTGKNISNWSSNVTNCITYIPQDIKLELNNGTLTLKAGSKVYVPNGFEQDGTTPKFDVVTIEIDKTYTGISFNGPCFLYVDSNKEMFISYTGENGSGPIAPANTTPRWYDTTNNLMKVTNNYSTWTTEYHSLPIALLTIQTSTPYIKSIDQVFNGFGYIGSTVFALPGVKGLIPNGRNADGTLNSTELTITSVQIKTFQYTGPVYFRINSNGIFDASIGYWVYNEQRNLWEHDSTISYSIVFATGYETSGVISNFTPKTAFHALDWNDKGTIAGWSMPSNKYIDLTLGSTGATYTAPANGWFEIGKGASSYQVVYMTNLTSRIRSNTTAVNSSEVLATFIPAKKGDSVMVEYNASGTTYEFKFVYAEGDK